MTDEEFDELWDSLTDNQRKFAIEYATTTSQADAARNVGLKPKTVYRWDGEDHKKAAKAIITRRRERVEDTVQGLSSFAVDALQRALDPDEETSRVEKEAAEYVIDRLEGKPTQKQEVQHSGGIDVSDIDADDIEEKLSHLEEEE